LVGLCHTVSFGACEATATGTIAGEHTVSAGAGVGFVFATITGAHLVGAAGRTRACWRANHHQTQQEQSTDRTQSHSHLSSHLDLLFAS
jgi:type IV secretory pathway TrbL component